MYDVAYHSLHLEGDILLGPQVVVLPVQQHHVGEELLPVHVAITRRVQLNGKDRPMSHNVMPVNDDHSVMNASPLHNEQLMQEREGQTHRQTDRDRGGQRQRDRQRGSETKGKREAK